MAQRWSPVGRRGPDYAPSQPWLRFSIMVWIMTSITASREIGLDRTKLLITGAHDAKVDSVAGEMNVLTEHEVLLVTSIAKM